jgi:hypothetical protein
MLFGKKKKKEKLSDKLKEANFKFKHLVIGLYEFNLKKIRTSLQNFKQGKPTKDDLAFYDNKDDVIADVESTQNILDTIKKIKECEFSKILSCVFSIKEDMINEGEPIFKRVLMFFGANFDVYL